MIDLLKAYFKIQDRDNQREIREKVTGKLLTLDKALEPTLPALLSLLDVPAEDSAMARLRSAPAPPAHLRSDQTLVVAREPSPANGRVFEDLHWIDSETQAFLDSMIDSLPTRRFSFLLITVPNTSMAGAARLIIDNCGSIRCRPRVPKSYSWLPWVTMRVCSR